MIDYLRRLKDAIKSIVAEENPPSPEFAGILGNHSGVVETGDPGIVYMTLTNTGQVIRLLNRRVPNRPGRYVIAGYDQTSQPNILQVLYERGVYGTDVVPSLVEHHGTHEYPSPDTVWVKDGQFLPLLTLPSSGMIVQVFGGWVKRTDGVGFIYIESQTVDLESYVPASGALYVLIDSDNDGALSVVEGSIVASIDILTGTDIPDPINIMVSCIKLYDGQTEIKRDDEVNDIVDLRFSGSFADVRNYFDYIDFNTAWTGASQEGRLKWNIEDGTLEVGMPGGNVNLQIGQEIFVPRKVKNTSGGDMKNGNLVYISGGTGTNAIISLADYSTEATSACTMAMLTEDIDDASFGYAVTFGLCRGDATQPIDTSAAAAGAQLYLAASGLFTHTKPETPNHLVSVGTVFRSHATEGIILVKITNGFEVGELHDVLLSSIANQQVIKWDSVGEYWKNTNPLEIDAYRFGFLTNYAGTQETTIAFDDSTYIFTLAPTGSEWSYYRSGIRYTITGSKTVTLAGTPPTKGLYYIYIDAIDGTLTASTTPWTLEDTLVPVASISWDDAATPKYWLANERHTCAIDRRFHWEHHFSDGTELITHPALTGYTVTPSSPSDTDNTFAISASVLSDEDLKIILAELTDPNGTATDYVIEYISAAAWYWEASAMPYRYTAAGYIQYNNAGTMTQGANNKYYNWYLVLTNSIGAARFQLIPGIGEYSSLITASAEGFSDLDLSGIGINEFVAVYQFIWQTSAAYSTKGKCRLATDPISIEVSASGAGAPGATTWGNIVGDIANQLDLVAANIPITDAGSYFTGTEVETALQELGASVSVPASGATLPVTPKSNQFFLHTPTGRNILYQYIGSTWYPIIAHGTTEFYVDGASGTDDQDNGFATGADAFATIQYAIDQVAGLNSGSVIINIAAGTYTENLVIQGKRFTGDFTISLVGETSTLDSITAASGVTGTGATQGSVTRDAGTWTVNERRHDFIVGTSGNNNGITRLIDSNTTTIATIVGTWYGAISVGDTFDVFENLTIIEGNFALDNGQKGVEFYYLDFDDNTVPHAIENASSLKTYYTRLLSPTTSANLGINSNGILTTEASYIEQDAAYNGVLMQGASIAVFNRSLIFSSDGGGNGLFMRANSAATLGQGSIIDNFNIGFFAERNSSGTYGGVTATTGDQQIRNCTTGARARNVSSINANSNVTYSANGTDENAESASYGYIG